MISIEATNTTIALRFFETWQTGDLELAETLLAPIFCDHNPTPGFVPDRAGTLLFMRHFRQAFPDLTFTLEDILASGDRVVDRWTMQATHLGPFLGTHPSHKRVTFTGIDILRIVDGQIVESWHQENQLEGLQQIGAVSILNTGEAPHQPGPSR